jgi:mRNA interferase MazF
MTGCDPGDIVLVRFPFTDLTSAKKRPAIIVSPSAYAQLHGDVVLIALTSQDQNDPALALAEWRAAGLPKPTWVKPLVGTLSAGLIERQLGRIDPRDRRCVRAAMDRLLGVDWG